MWGHWMFQWWRHRMETFSALLALCVGNSSVTGEFPSQRPVPPSIPFWRHGDAWSIITSKRGPQITTHFRHDQQDLTCLRGCPRSQHEVMLPGNSSFCHKKHIHEKFEFSGHAKWCHDMKTLAAFWTFVKGNPLATNGFPWQISITTELWHFLCLTSCSICQWFETPRRWCIYNDPRGEISNSLTHVKNFQYAGTVFINVVI